MHHVSNLIDFSPLPAIPRYQFRLVVEKVDGRRAGHYSSGGCDGRIIIRTVKTEGPTNGLKVKLVDSGRIGNTE